MFIDDAIIILFLCILNLNYIEFLYMKNLKRQFYSKNCNFVQQVIFAFSFICYTALSFKTTSIILVILRKTIIFAHSDAGSTASGVSFYRSYKIIFVGRNQMRQRSFFDFRLNFRYAKIRFILLICNILHV